MKRFVDVFISLGGLVFLSPLLLVLAVFVKLQDFGPVLFAQERVGRGGRVFKMFKFRTMVVGAGDLGGSLTVEGDRRITAIGRWLRMTKADELPQLWNVVRGEMSLVGPRPEVKKYVDLYTDAQRAVLELRPGITDLASFAFFNESEILARAADPEAFYVGRILPEKIRINLAYAARATVVSDLLLIEATVLRAAGIKFDLFAWFKIAPPDLKAPA